MVGVILASGESTRMNTNKLLLRYKEKELVKWVIESAKKSNLNEVIVVYKDEAVKKIAQDLNVKAIKNEKFKNGQSESIKVAINNIDNNKDIMFIVGDIPLITSETINNLIDKFNNSGHIVACKTEGFIKNPVIFSKEFKDMLLALEGDTGGKEVIQKNLDKVSFYEVCNKEELADIDTMLEYDKLIKSYIKLSNI